MMRKPSHAAPCRTLSAEQCAEVERQLREQGRLRAASEAELTKLRNARKLKAGLREQRDAQTGRPA
jgi:hypothetical protein